MDKVGGAQQEFDSCIQLLNGRLQVQWEAVLDGVIIRLSAKMDENEYAAFGISGAEGRTRMIGGDVTVVYFNSEDSKFHADDYHLGAKSQVGNIFIISILIVQYLYFLK